MNLYEIHSKDILALDEYSRVSLIAHLEFRAKIEATNPDYLRYLCHHGRYIGHEGLFANKCQWCKMEADNV